MRASILRVSFLVLAIFAVRPAQGTAQLSPGTRVRMRLDTTVTVRQTNSILSPDVWWVGELVSREGDTLTFRVSGDSAVAISRRQIEALEVSAGYHSNVLGGALAGGLLGAGVGFLLSHLNSCSNPSSSISCLSGSEIGKVTAVSALLGAGVGAAVGSSSHERWRRVTDLVTVIPRGLGSVGVELALRW